MEHAKRLYLIDEFDRVQTVTTSGGVSKRIEAYRDDTLRNSNLDEHEKMRAEAERQRPAAASVGGTDAKARAKRFADRC